jgi:antitoxin ParD1/3/4
MSIRQSINLDPYYSEFALDLVKSGRYDSVSEVIQKALSQMMTRERKLELLREEIREGIDSGIAHGFDPAENLSRLKEKRGLAGG